MSAEKETSGAVGSVCAGGYPIKVGVACGACGATENDMCPHAFDDSTFRPQDRANPSPPHAEKLKGAEAPSINESIYWSKEDTYDAPPTPTPETNSNE